MPDQIQYGLGRKYSPDHRDRLYPIELALGRMSVERRTAPWRRERVLDQGQTGTCVGHGWRGWLEGEPRPHEASYGLDAFAIYRQAILLDEWAGNDAEETLPNDQLQEGTSVRAGAKAMQQDGYIKSYLWATKAAQVADFVTRAAGSPVVLGSRWYVGMFSPDEHGRVRLTGGVAGGHCWVSFWWDGRYHWNYTSWGEFGIRDRDGISGVFLLSAGQMDRLIREQGEACCGVEFSVEPAT